MRLMKNASNPRLLALDQIRGLVMVLMAVDHASIIYNNGRLALDSAATYLPGTPLPLDQFLTRWITHLAAPTFVFLAGAALALSCHKRTALGQPNRAINVDIMIRGLIIASIDLLWVPLIAHKWTLQVMFAMGTAMLAMAWLRRLSDMTLLIIASMWLLIGEALTTLWWDPTKGNPALPLALAMAVFYSDELSVIYPVLPWLAVMMLGWVFGRYLIRVRVQPAGLLAVVGTALLLVFLVVRGLNGYGNMLLLRADSTLVHWLHVSKYPPGLSFFTLELGLMALGLAVLMTLERHLRPRQNSPLLVFGQTPLFFYLLHVPLLAAPAIVFGLFRAGSLAWAYGAAATVLALLYPLCRRYRSFKFAHPEAWVRYI